MQIPNKDRHPCIHLPSPIPLPFTLEASESRLRAATSTFVPINRLRLLKRVVAFIGIPLGIAAYQCSRHAITVKLSLHCKHILCQILVHFPIIRGYSRVQTL